RQKEHACHARCSSQTCWLSPMRVSGPSISTNHAAGRGYATKKKTWRMPCLLQISRRPERRLIGLFSLRSQRLASQLPIRAKCPHPTGPAAPDSAHKPAADSPEPISRPRPALGLEISAIFDLIVLQLTHLAPPCTYTRASC